MMISLDANTTRIIPSGTSDSFSHTVGTAGQNNGLFVLVYLNGNSTTTPSNVSCTYGGVSMTKIGESTNLTGYILAAAFYLAKPLTGSNTVAPSWTTSSQGLAIARSYYGIDQSNPVRSGSYTYGASNSTPSSLTVTCNIGDMALDVIGLESPGTSLSVGAGQTQIYNHNIAGVGEGAFSYEESTGSSVTMSWTKTNGVHYVHASFAIVPSGSSGGVAVSPMMVF